jgi:hypothetical protein
MKRQLFNVLAGVSLLLCLAILLLWFISASTPRQGIPVLQSNFSDGYIQLSSNLQHVEFAVITSPWHNPDGKMFVCYDGDNARVKGADSFTLGVYIGSTRIVPAGKCFVIVLPYWLLLLAFATYPAVTFGRRGWLAYRFGVRQQQSLCTNCGYDLQATPDRCPECGTIPPQSDLISN